MKSKYNQMLYNIRQVICPLNGRWIICGIPELRLVPKYIYTRWAVQSMSERGKGSKLSRLYVPCSKTWDP